MTRRPRYAGRHPRAFHEKYKELQPDRYPGDVDKVLQSGKTPAGMHRPIMVDAVLRVLAPRPGDVVVDATLGYGGHTRALLAAVAPGGRVIGLDQDPIELPRTEARLRAAGYGEEVFSVRRTSFAGLARVLGEAGLAADVVFADLGLSSMQIDDPARGFTFKQAAPLDMRMNPTRGETAAAWLRRVGVATLAEVLDTHGDEPDAAILAARLAGQSFTTTRDLAEAIRATVAGAHPRRTGEDLDRAVRRVFQAVRIAVNDEFGALEALLRQVPLCLAPGGRVAVLSFHSGEDRRVKKAFAAGLREGHYAAVGADVERAAADEVRSNPRAASAKLRWARRAG